MPKRCYVQWCFSGYDSECRDNKTRKQRNKTMFRAPKDPELRKKWHDAIGRTNRLLSNSDAVCELHFAESDLQRFYETLMPDGTIHRIPRRCRLKPGAIPDMSIRKDYSTDLYSMGNIIENEHILVLSATEDTPEKISEKGQANDPASATQVSCTEVDPLKIDPVEEVITLQPHGSSNDVMRGKFLENNIYTIQNLRTDLLTLRLPEGWAYVCFNEEIRFSCWKLKADLTMMLTVKNDMTGKVSVPEGLTIETDLLNLTSFEAFSQSLILLRKVILCEGSGTSSRRAESCPLIMRDSAHFPRGVCSRRCLPCRILRTQELGADRKREIRCRNKIIEYQKTLKLTKRQNVRLQMKVLKLQTALNIEKNKSGCW